MSDANFYFDGSPYDNGAGKAARKAKRAEKNAGKAAKKEEKEGTWLSRTIDNVKNIADGTSKVAGLVSGVAGMFSKDRGTTVETAEDFQVVDPNKPAEEPKFLGMPKTIGIMVTAMVGLMIVGLVIYLIFRK